MCNANKEVQSWDRYDVTMKMLWGEDGAVFEIDGKLVFLISLLPYPPNAVGQTGVLRTFSTEHGPVYRIYPYPIQSWRREPAQDRSGVWAWRCQISGAVEWREVGSPPDFEILII